VGCSSYRKDPTETKTFRTMSSQCTICADAGIVFCLVFVVGWSSCSASHLRYAYMRLASARRRAAAFVRSLIGLFQYSIAVLPDRRSSLDRSSISSACTMSCRSRSSPGTVIASMSAPVIPTLMSTYLVIHINLAQGRDRVA